MTSPTSSLVFIPESREFCWGIENVAAGTAASAASTPPGFIMHEVARDCSITYQRQKFQSTGFRKAAATRGKSYITQRWVEVSIILDYHSAGFAAFALGIPCGNASEGAVTGVAVKTHPFVPNALGNRMNTVTLWLDYGDHNHVQKCTRGTVSHWSTSVNGDGGMEVTITVVANYVTYTSAVTPSIFLGSTANYLLTPILGSQGTYTILNGAGSAYTFNITGCMLDFQRNVTPLPNGQSIDPADFNANELVLSGSVNFQWDGMGPNSAFDDFSQYTQNGGSGTPNTIGFTNTDGHGFAVDFYYLRWENPGFDFGGAATQGNFSFTTENDESQLDQASPVITAPKQIRILNALSSAMTS